MDMVFIFDVDHAPITRGMIQITIIVSVFLFLFPLSDLFTFTHLYPFLFPKFQLWRPITSLFFYSSIFNTLIASTLFYFFRIIERCYGTAKFAVCSFQNPLQIFQFLVRQLYDYLFMFLGFSSFCFCSQFSIGNCNYDICKL